MKEKFYQSKDIAVWHGDKGFKLRDYSTTYKTDLKKSASKDLLIEMQQRMQQLQDMLYAQDKYSLLLVFQAMDAAGKDGTIRSVMSGVNPQGCHVVSFKAPSSKELDHDYLWRTNRELPERGRIGIFNRSHYEEVLVTKVHPKFIVNQRLPGINDIADITGDFWEKRYAAIRSMEKHLFENGTLVLKFFLHVGKDVQKKRFLERIEDPEKNWKFSYRDIEERPHWDAYQKAYEEAIAETARPWAPWFIIPADHNWMRNFLVCDLIVEALESLDLQYPKLPEAEMQLLHEAKSRLLAE
jgi:PPK2 family polyphosphate:nucleotide phosphotransferase